MKSLSEVEVDKFIIDGVLRIRLDESTEEAIAAVFGAAYHFFRATAEEKAPNKLPEDAGYRPYGIEYSQSPNILDQIESFTASDRTRSMTDLLPVASAQLLHRQMLRAFDVLEDLAETFTIRLAETVSGRAYEKKIRGAMSRWSRLQVNYSRPASTRTGLINEAHEDGVLMSLVCATCPGFEVQTPDGGFALLTTMSGEVIAMAGEITWLISGGRIPPVYHRVRPVGEYPERLSLIFLGDIHPKLCEPWVENEVNANVNIGERVLTSASRFGLQAFSGE